MNVSNIQDKPTLLIILSALHEMLNKRVGGKLLLSRTSKEGVLLKMEAIINQIEKL
jgi:hypothetical protein